MTKSSFIGPYKQTLARWGLDEIPFRETPPEDPKILRRVFHGREPELARSLPTLYEGRNVLVRGVWGVGKTTFILYLLDKLQLEVAELQESALILYVGQFPGAASDDFFRALIGETQCH
jgi:hypothetical protein